MSIIKEQQQALDDVLVPQEQRLRIGNYNYRLSTTFKPKEPTFQVALDALSLTPFYQAFLISTNAYKTYYDLATGKVIPKPKYVWRSTREKTDQAPKASLGTHEGTSVTPGVPDVPTYGSEDERISWKSSDDENDDEVSENVDNEDYDDHDDDNANKENDDGQDDDNEQTESDNDGDDFVHPKLFTFDEEERHEKSWMKKKREEKLDEEKTNEEEEVNELYNDVNINLEGRDTEMTNALLANVQATQVIEDTHVIMTAVNPEVQQQSSSVSSGFISKMLNHNPDTRIDSILNLNTKSTSLVDVPITTNDEKPPSSVTTLPPLPIPPIQPVQQTPASTLKLRQKIIKEQAKVQVKEQVSKILPRIEKSVNKMENNKSIDRSVQQKTLYKALVDAYKIDKDILATYEDNIILKIHLDDEDDDEEPSAGSNRGSKKRRARKEHKSSSEPKEKSSKSTGKSKEGSKSHQKSIGKSTEVEEPIHTVEDLEEPTHQEFETSFTEDHPVDETTLLPD
uniref:Retrovirus-related Pol polyprotein from transposon TNT 1-94 n=1 Tax=Tanacetum cinerariifolium TaxID=118510 RepID=A0A6L2J8S6_TANCI|nr:hypothetical protein [Tanacetum cinerariifolium]